ncbi:MAG: nitroreductase family protein [Sphaerochaetaceae bacterium]|jgi:nitroreductase
MNETLQTIFQRRSVRAYSDRPVQDTDVELIVRAGRYAPSGMNTQGWHFTVLRNQDKLKSLGERVAGVGQTFFYNAPVLILVSYRIGNRFAEDDCACAMMNMMLAATSLGLGSVWCNRINGNSQFDTSLQDYGVPAGYQVHGCLALGYASSPLPADRENKSDTVTYL